MTAESPKRLAQHKAWYAANRERHKARQRARYVAKREHIIATVARYRHTAAGMLNEARHNARKRSA